MTDLIDSPSRERFAEELETSFSVIAPAGVGKTTAIIERVARLLKTTSRPVALVTYTRRAANEMHQRLITKAGAAGADPERLYVGTIHGLCAQLLRADPERFGVGGTFEIASATPRLWSEFLEDCPLPLEGAQAERFYKYFENKTGWLELFFKQFPVDFGTSQPPPDPDYEKVRQLQPPDGRTRTAIEKLKEWAESWRGLAPDALWAHTQLPTSKSEKVAEIFEEVLGPYKAWRSAEGLRAAAAISQKFRAWRLERGKLTYDDLISVVHEHLDMSLGYSVILDEAQDTSIAQLELLQKAARRAGGKIDFSMVGDPQQSIYGQRAKLADYLATHEQLLRSGQLQELTFRVTFRCSRQVVSFVNAQGEKLLSGQNGQARFVELIPKPLALEGAVQKLTLASPRWEFAGVDAATAAAAAALVKKLKDFPRENLHEVAVLAPRRSWLQSVAAACQREGIPAQLHMETVAPSAALGLARSVLHLMSYPDDSFELVGLLRETSALGDRDLAQAVQSTPQAFSLARAEAHAVEPAVDEALTTLKAAWAHARTLPPAMAFLHFCAACRIREAHARNSEGAVAEWEELLEALLPALKLPMADNIDGIAELLKERTVRPGHLQLLTMHKAKGLEWDVVILPFLKRPVGEHPQALPRFVEGERPQLFFEEGQTLPEAVKVAQTQENARLLYVALTRARRQLILVDDAAYFPEEKDGSLMSLLQETPETLFAPLSEADALDAQPPRRETVSRSLPPEVHLPAALPVVVPSRLVQSTEELTEEQRLGEGGARYGNWWHDLWPATGFPRSAQTLFAAAEKSPYPARARREIEALLSHPLYSLLAGANCRFEENFLAKVADHVVEGRLDLLASFPDGSVAIVDWKTDQVSPEALVASYGAQLEAYREGVSALLKRPVRATLYSTFHGVWLNSDGTVLRS